MNEKRIVDLIGKAPVYEQLAEECAELAQASLKMARIIRNENPTPVTQAEAEKQLTEEFTDIFQCALELQLKIDFEQIDEKDTRWRKRISERSKSK